MANDERFLTIHFGVGWPPPPTPTPTPDGERFRWEKPTDTDDAGQTVIGSRSGYLIAGHAQVQSEVGPDAYPFVRKGIPDEDADPLDWIPERG